MNKRIPIIIVLSLFLEAASFGQEVTQIYGKIRDDNNTPLPFSNIYIQNKSIGTIANSDGEFVLKVESSVSDTLVISHIGYQIRHIALSTIENNSVSIVLKEATVRLDEITILPMDLMDNPKRIVKNAIERIPENHNLDAFVLKGFYRHLNKEDDEYKRLIEAAITLLDSGYTTNLQKFDLTEIRRSIDHRKPQNKKIMEIIDSYISDKDKSIFKMLKSSVEMKSILNDTAKSSAEDLLKWERKYDKEALRSFYQTNFARHHLSKKEYTYGALNSSFVKEHRFKLDTISAYNDELVYVIKILPSPRSKKFSYESRNLIVPVGKIHIRTNDFAVLRMEYSYILNPKKRGTQNYNFYLKSRGSGIMFKTVAAYQEYYGKMYLSYLYKLSGDRFASSISQKRESNYTKGYFFVEREFLVNEIIIDPKEVKNIYNTFEWDDQLYQKHSTYNENFWKSYNVLKETPIQEKLREDLEQKVSLEEQFKKSGNQ